MGPSPGRGQVSAPRVGASGRALQVCPPSGLASGASAPLRGAQGSGRGQGGGWGSERAGTCELPARLLC